VLKFPEVPFLLRAWLKTTFLPSPQSKILLLSLFLTAETSVSAVYGLPRNMYSVPLSRPELEEGGFSRFFNCPPLPSPSHLVMRSFFYELMSGRYRFSWLYTFFTCALLELL